MGDRIDWNDLRERRMAEPGAAEAYDVECHNSKIDGRLTGQSPGPQAMPSPLRSRLWRSRGFCTGSGG